MPKHSGPNLSRHERANRRSRQALSLALSAVVLAAGGNQGFSSCSSNVKKVITNPAPGASGFSEKIPIIVTKDPVTQYDLTLDCIDYYRESDGAKVTDSDLQGPRVMVFASQISLFAADVRVEYGHVVIGKNGRANMDLSKVDIHNYWIAENNTGETATTSYGSGNGPLPSQHEWESHLLLTPQLDENGTQLPVIGTNPDGNGSQVVVGKTAYFNDDLDDGQVEQLTLHDTGLVDIECRRAKNNVPLGDDPRVTADEILIINVANSPTPFHSTLQN